MGQHLIVEISHQKAKIRLLNGNQSDFDQTISFLEKNELKMREQLEQFFKDNNLFTASVDNVSVSFAGFNTTIVPSTVFSESKPEEIYELCFGKNTLKKDIDYNRISDQLIVNIFELPLWVKSFFVTKFPLSIIQHESTFLLRKISQEPGFKLKMNLIIHDDYFLIIAIQNNQLQYYSSFEYSENSDILYHLGFVMQQKEWMDEELKIFLSPGINIGTSKLEQLKTDFDKLFPRKTINIEINDQLIKLAHQLCVS